MAPAEEHIRELLRLSAGERVRAAKRLLDSLDESDLRFATSSGPLGPTEADDDLADLDEVAADKEGLRAAVRAAVEAELEPLHELTSLLRRFAELARTTGHALRAKAT